MPCRLTHSIYSGETINYQKSHSLEVPSWHVCITIFYFLKWAIGVGQWLPQRPPSPTVTTHQLALFWIPELQIPLVSWGDYGTACPEAGPQCRPPYKSGPPIPVSPPQPLNFLTLAFMPGSGPSPLLQCCGCVVQAYILTFYFAFNLWLAIQLPTQAQNLHYLQGFTRNETIKLLG